LNAKIPQNCGGIEFGRMIANNHKAERAGGEQLARFSFVPSWYRPTDLQAPVA
jgi:hypothetical protein